MNKNNQQAVTILTAVLVVFMTGGFYFFSHTLNSYKLEADEREKKIRALVVSQQLVLEELRADQKKAQTSLATSAYTEIEGSAVFAEWAKRVVKIRCKEGDNEFEGSGALLFKEGDDSPFVVSNAHVVASGRVCTVLVEAPDNKTYEYKSFSLIPNEKYDLALVFLDGTLKGEEVAGPLKGAPAARELTFSKNYAYCSENDVNAGDKVYILGYPAIGGSTLTITEGIISGSEGVYYKTSAKIGEGNSGGVAILARKNCYIGIPTEALVGRVESLGYILNLTIIKNLFE